MLSVYSFFIYLLLWTFCSYPLPIFFFWDSDLFTLMIYRCSLYIKGIDTLLCLLQISFLYIISHLIFYVVFVIERLKQTIEKPWPYLITFSFVVLYFYVLSSFLIILSHWLYPTEFEAWVITRWLTIHSNKTRDHAGKNEKITGKCVCDHLCSLI